ncbi:hypothetical protein ACFYYB_33755 [Streptomyces sp. NPDC002886]|uniref:hypothetical protein n=1 Tax=Streptomyces sp. NPDC002886 TaxID=3364667 RepID=UPI0036C74CA2
MKTARSIPMVLAASLALAVLNAFPSPAFSLGGTAPWRALSRAQDRGDGLQACVNEAQDKQSEAWTCMGGTLRVTEDNRGRVTDAAYLVAEDTTVTPAPRAMAPAKDDYDSWCENGTICGRKINAFTAEVKGNGAYGDSKGVIGTFDIVYRQSFDGKLPRWRTLIEWDSGPEINPGIWRNNCRVNLSGRPDDYCGKNDVHLASVNAKASRSWWPSSERWAYNDQRLTGGGNYHDDHEGEFTAFGHRQLFKAGVLHTGRWSKCNSRTGCQYYQVPWKP